MEYGASSSLPSTQEVLSEHVYTLVHDMVPHYADKVTGMLLECPVSEVMAVISDKDTLRMRVNKAVDALRRAGDERAAPLSGEKEKLGEELFEKVSEIESELCAQITGMLLERDLATLRGLLENPGRLESAVSVARSEYLRERHPTCLPTREELGEEIYEYVSLNYPEDAAKVTGMLLELELKDLQYLVDHPDLLQARVNQARRVLNALPR